MLIYRKNKRNKSYKRWLDDFYYESKADRYVKVKDKHKKRVIEYGETY